MTEQAVKYPSTETGFKRRFPDYAQHTIHSLTQGLGCASGSKWKVDHLRACRVLFKSCADLPALKSYRAAASERVGGSPMLSGLTKLSVEEVRQMCHRDLRLAGEAFGSFYVALADVMSLPESPASIRSSTRIRGPPTRPPEWVTGQGYSSPSTAGIPSSTSSYLPSSQGEEDFDAQLDRAKHEAVSADLAAQFISSVLDLLSAETEQTARTRFRIEYSREPTRFNLKSSTFSCSCEDDGSIVRRRRQLFASEWRSDRTFLCSLEAKAKYTQADAESGTPTASDRVLAQLACELLGAMMTANSELDDEYFDEERRFLISIHQQNMVFLEADFSEEYIKYIYSRNDMPEAPYLTIYRSREYDLARKEDRKAAAEVLIALAGWFEETMGGVMDTGSEDAEDETGPGTE